MASEDARRASELALEGVTQLSEGAERATEAISTNTSTSILGGHQRRGELKRTWSSLPTGLLPKKGGKGHLHRVINGRIRKKTDDL